MECRSACKSEQNSSGEPCETGHTTAAIRERRWIGNAEVDSEVAERSSRDQFTVGCAAKSRVNDVAPHRAGQATTAGYRLPFDAEFAIRSVSFRPTVRDSGRLVLSELRRRSFCHPSDRPNRIPALVSLAGKRAWLAVNLMTVVRRLAKYFGHPVDQTEAQSGHWDITRIVRLD